MALEELSNHTAGEEPGQLSGQDCLPVNNIHFVYDERLHRLETAVGSWSRRVEADLWEDPTPDEQQLDAVAYKDYGQIRDRLGTMPWPELEWYKLAIKREQESRENMRTVGDQMASLALRACAEELRLCRRNYLLNNKLELTRLIGLHGTLAVHLRSVTEPQADTRLAILRGFEVAEYLDDSAALRPMLADEQGNLGRQPNDYFFDGLYFRTPE